MSLMINATSVDQTGRTLSGQTTEAFFVVISHTKPLTVGFNCALGAWLMRHLYQKLSYICPGWIAAAATPARVVAASATATLQLQQ